MSTNLDKKKGRQAGLRVYLKSILGELNCCVLDEGSEQAKIVGFKASVKGNLKGETLAAISGLNLNFMNKQWRY